MTSQWRYAVLGGIPLLIITLVLLISYNQPRPAGNNGITMAAAESTAVVAERRRLIGKQILRALEDSGYLALPAGIPPGQRVQVLAYRMPPGTARSWFFDGSEGWVVECKLLPMDSLLFLVPLSELGIRMPLPVRQ